MSLMSYLTRFDSEMHEDEDDLEEVAAPIGDQQGKKSVSVDDLNDALMEETTDESEAEGQLDLMMRLLLMLMKLLLLVVVILMFMLVLLLMLMLTLLLILILKLVLLMLTIIFWGGG